MSSVLVEYGCQVLFEVFNGDSAVPHSKVRVIIINGEEILPKLYNSVKEASSFGSDVPRSVPLDLLLLLLLWMSSFGFEV